MGALGKALLADKEADSFFRPAHKIRADINRSLLAEGVLLDSKEAEPIIYAYLGMPSKSRCKCGAPLAIWEMLNKACATCVEKEIRRERALEMESRARWGK